MRSARHRPVLQYLRQIIAADNAHARTIMWQSDVKWQDAVVEYRLKGAKDIAASPAERETFSDDGVSVELYTARLVDLKAGEPYEYRISKWTANATTGTHCRRTTAARSRR